MQCITDLVNLQHAKCNYEKVYNSGIIKRIDEAIILLNNVNITLQSNCTNNTQNLKGSYLIYFKQCEITIENNKFTNIIMEYPENIFRPTTGLMVYEENIIDIPPPEYIANLTITHRSMLDHVYLENESLKWKLHIFGGISFTTILIIIIILISISILSKWKKPKFKVTLQSETTTASAPEDIPMEVSYPDISIERQNEIQKFINLSTADKPIRF